MRTDLIGEVKIIAFREAITWESIPQILKVFWRFDCVIVTWHVLIVKVRTGRTKEWNICYENSGRLAMLCLWERICKEKTDIPSQDGLNNFKLYQGWKVTN